MSSSLSVTSDLPETLASIQRRLIQYVYPVWLVFGVTGCFLSLLVFSRPQLRGTSCSIYFFAASLDHLLTLILGIGPVVYALTNADPQTNSLVFCKVRGYLFQITLMLSRWFVAFACIDRYALSSDNVNLRRFANRQHAYRSIAIIAIIWSVLCSHRLIFYEIQGNLCGIMRNVPAAVYHSVYVIIGGGVVPTVIMTVCAFLIRHNLVLKKQKRTHLTVVDHSPNALDHQVLVLLFIQIVCYMIFTLPQLSNLVFSAISNTIENRSQDRLAIERFAAFLAELMLYMFPVTSFYLYTLTSRTFRRELLAALRLLPIVGRLCRKTRVAPTWSTATAEHHTGHQHPASRNPSHR